MTSLQNNSAPERDQRSEALSTTALSEETTDMTILNNIPVSGNTPTLSAARPRRTLTARQAWWRAHRRLLKDVRSLALWRGKGSIVHSILELHDLERDDSAGLIVPITARACRDLAALSIEQANNISAERPARWLSLDAMKMKNVAHLHHAVASALELAGEMAFEEEKAAASEAAQ